MYFVVISAHGPAWDHSRGLREQAAWDDHAAFMDALTDEGFVALGGPLGDGAMLIVEAPDRETAAARLAADPWRDMHMLELTSIQPWEILLGHLPPR